MPGHFVPGEVIHAVAGMPYKGAQETATTSKGTRGALSTVGALGRGPTYMRVTTPVNLDLALEGLVRKVLREQPKQDEIYAFAADYFETLVDIRDKAENPDATPSDICPNHSEAEAGELIKLASSFAKPLYNTINFEKSYTPDKVQVVEEAVNDNITDDVLTENNKTKCVDNQLENESGNIDSACAVEVTKEVAQLDGEDDETTGDEKNKEISQEMEKVNEADAEAHEAAADQEDSGVKDDSYPNEPDIPQKEEDDQKEVEENIIENQKMEGEEGNDGGDEKEHNESEKASLEPEHALVEDPATAEKPVLESPHEGRFEIESPDADNEEKNSADSGKEETVTEGEDGLKNDVKEPEHTIEFDEILSENQNDPSALLIAEEQNQAEKESLMEPALDEGTPQPSDAVVNKTKEMEQSELLEDREVTREFITREKNFAMMGNCSRSIEAVEVYERKSTDNESIASMPVSNQMDAIADNSQGGTESDVLQSRSTELLATVVTPEDINSGIRNSNEVMEESTDENAQIHEVALANTGDESPTNVGGDDQTENEAHVISDQVCKEEDKVIENDGDLVEEKKSEDEENVPAGDEGGSIINDKSEAEIDTEKVKVDDEVLQAILSNKVDSAVSQSTPSTGTKDELVSGFISAFAQDDAQLEDEEGKDEMNLHGEAKAKDKINLQEDESLGVGSSNDEETVQIDKNDEQESESMLAEKSLVAEESTTKDQYETDTKDLETKSIAVEKQCKNNQQDEEKVDETLLKSDDQSDDLHQNEENNEHEENLSENEDSSPVGTIKNDNDSTEEVVENSVIVKNNDSKEAITENDTNEQDKGNAPKETAVKNSSVNSDQQDENQTEESVLPRNSTEDSEPRPIVNPDDMKNLKEEDIKKELPENEENGVSSLEKEVTATVDDVIEQASTQVLGSELAAQNSDSKEILEDDVQAEIINENQQSLDEGAEDENSIENKPIENEKVSAEEQNQPTNEELEDAEDSDAILAGTVKLGSKEESYHSRSSMDTESLDEENPFISAEVKTLVAKEPISKGDTEEDEADVISPLNAKIGTIEELDEDPWGSQVSAIRAAMVIQKNFRKFLERRRAQSSMSDEGVVCISSEQLKKEESSTDSSSSLHQAGENNFELSRLDTAIEKMTETTEPIEGLNIMNSPRERMKTFSATNKTIDDSVVWETLESELDMAASTIQHGFKEYETRVRNSPEKIMKSYGYPADPAIINVSYKDRQRERLRREDAVQITSEESESSPKMARLLGTGELHDIIIPEEH